VKSDYIRPGQIIESGFLPNGVPYRIWRGTMRGTRGPKARVYVGDGVGVKRNVKWLREIQTGRRVLIDGRWTKVKDLK
jgi:hypothetical protein